MTRARAPPILSRLSRTVRRKSVMSGKDPRIVAEIARIIAKELGVGEGQVAAAIQLIEEGASVPFIARYRKEKTGGLDDTQLRTLAERLEYLTILADRREVVLRSIRE